MKPWFHEFIWADKMGSSIIQSTNLGVIKSSHHQKPPKFQRDFSEFRRIPRNNSHCWKKPSTMTSQSGRILSRWRNFITGWWWLVAMALDYFPRNIGWHSSSQLTNSYFSAGWLETTNQIRSDPIFVLRCLISDHIWEVSMFPIKKIGRMYFGLNCHWVPQAHDAYCFKRFVDVSFKPKPSK